MSGWYRSSGKKYPESEPHYFNSADFSWAITLEEKWDEIKGEVRALVAESDKEFTSNSYLGLDSKGGWSSLSYIFWGLETKRGFKKKCPVLNGYLKKIPGLISLSFSSLAPHSDIREHYGFTNTIVRCHYGIDIPEGLPACGLKVNGEERAWHEGKWIIFIDAYLHSAWNHSDKRRIVMVIDVVRPEFLHKQKQIGVFIRARSTQIKIIKKYIFLNKMPKFIKELIFMGIYAGIYMLQPLHAASEE